MEVPTASRNEPPANAFFNHIRNPFKLRLFLIRNLPSAYFAGLRVVAASEDTCTVSVPYKWFTRNPFGSTYFACLSMAAELSTGVLAMAQVSAQQPGVSMLVTGSEARFYKKAKGLTLFTCNEGLQIKEAVALARSSGLPQTKKVYTEGRNNQGELIAAFWFEWSFLLRKVRSRESQ